MTTITVKSQPWTKYNLTKPLDGTEEKAALENWVVQVKAYLQVTYKDRNPGVENLVYIEKPNDWTHVLTPWVLEGSDPAELLLRPGITQAEFYETLLKRCKPQSAIVDSSFRDFIVQSCTPHSIDRHYRDIYNFASNFFDTEMKQRLDDHQTLALTIPILTDPTGPLSATKTNTAPVAARVRDELAVVKLKNLETTKAVFVARFCSLYLQGMLSADPALYQLLEPNQIPMESTSPQIVEMVHTKILKPKNAYIALRPHGAIASPLTPRPARPENRLVPERDRSIRERDERNERDFNRSRKPVDKSIDLREPRESRDRRDSRDSDKSSRDRPSSHSTEREKKKSRFDEPKKAKLIDKKDWCAYCKKHAPEGNDRFTNHKIKNCYFDPASRAFRKK
jgi:hypothetical protein